MCLLEVKWCIFSERITFKKHVRFKHLHEIKTASSSLQDTGGNYFIRTKEMK